MPNTTAITHAKIFTVDHDFTVIDDGTVIFDETGILELGPSEAVTPPDGAHLINGNNRLAVLPGLIDVHSHSSLLKGFSENAQLMDWLPEYQREHQVLTDEDAYYGCMVSYMEALRGGTTTVADMYRKLHKAAEAAERIGIRAELIPYAADNPDKTFFETLADTEQLIETWHGRANGKIHAWVGLEHITYCSAAMYTQANELALKHGVHIHTHTSEQVEEVSMVEELFGQRPVKQFAEYGILRPGTVLAHCVWLDDEEIATLATTGTGVAHCPISNMKLASGIAPLPRYLSEGIAVGLGSDGGISNNSLSMFECMKTASLLQKVHHLDATAISARQALELATIGGARLLSLDQNVGSIELGKQADLITIDLWQPHLLPISPAEGHDPVLWNLVFAARASDVVDVWIQGEQLINQGEFTRIDEDPMLQAIHDQTLDLLKRRQDVQAIPMVAS
jgi:5-methylthioadenosine/S-adenosylhomocysteine deaminase